MEHKKKKTIWKWIPFIAVLSLIAFQLERQLNFAPDYPKSYEAKNFPLHAQPDGITCGPTSLKMMLEHYGKEHTVDELKKKAKTRLFTFKETEVGGTAPDQMEVTLEHFGVPCDLVHSDIDQLKQYVSEGRLPTALVRSSKKTWHWIVVIGYTEKEIITADPGGGVREVLSTETFEGAWKFTHDLRGRDMSTPCSACNGTGHYKEWLGPFGKCDICGGLKKMPDMFWFLVGLGEAEGYTLIVPKEKPNEKIKTASVLQDKRAKLQEAKNTGRN